MTATPASAAVRDMLASIKPGTQGVLDPVAWLVLADAYEEAGDDAQARHCRMCSELPGAEKAVPGMLERKIPGLMITDAEVTLQGVEITYTRDGEVRRELLDEMAVRELVDLTSPVSLRLAGWHHLIGNPEVNWGTYEGHPAVIGRFYRYFILGVIAPRDPNLATRAEEERLRIKYQTRDIVPDSLTKVGANPRFPGKRAVTIRCYDCSRERTIATQDLFQVRRCSRCQSYRR